MEAGTAILNGLHREGLAVEVRGDQRREGGDRKSHVCICVRSVPGRENNTFKEPQWGACLGRRRKSKRWWSWLWGALWSKVTPGKRGPLRVLSLVADTAEERELPCGDQRGGNCKTPGDGCWCGMTSTAAAEARRVRGFWAHFGGRVPSISQWVQSVIKRGDRGRESGPR